MNRFILLFISLFLLVGSGFSQKIKIKDNVVFADGKPVFKMEMKLASERLVVSNLNDEKLANIQYEEYRDRRYITDGNQEGKIGYFTITFYDSTMSQCEFDVGGLRKAVASYLLEFDVIKDNQLNEDAIAKFVKIHGNKFSEERSHSTTIIIQR